MQGHGKPTSGVCRLSVRVACSLASHELHVLHAGEGGGAGTSSGGGLPAELSNLRVPGVFAIYDAGGALVYVGVTRNLSSSLAGLAGAFPAADAARAKAKPMPGADGAALQAAWKAWVVEHRALPPGNARGADPR